MMLMVERIKLSIPITIKYAPVERLNIHDPQKVWKQFPVPVKIDWPLQVWAGCIAIKERAMPNAANRRKLTDRVEYCEVLRNVL